MIGPEKPVFVEFESHQDSVSYSDWVTLQAIDRIEEHLNGGVFLDVGSGDKSGLEHRLAKGGNLQYVALDLIKNWPGEDYICGSSLALPIQSDSISIVHERFMSAWIPPHMQRIVMSELIRVLNSDGHILQISYDWSSVGGSEFAERFQSVISRLSPYTGFDPYYGAKFCASWRALGDNIEVVEERYNLGMGDHREEALAWIRGAKLTQLGKVSGDDHNKISADLDEAEKICEDASRSIPFKMPDIAVVTVGKLN